MFLAKIMFLKSRTVLHNTGRLVALGITNIILQQRVIAAHSIALNYIQISFYPCICWILSQDSWRSMVKTFTIMTLQNIILSHKRFIHNAVIIDSTDRSYLSKVYTWLKFQNPWLEFILLNSNCTYLLHAHYLYVMTFIVFFYFFFRQIHNSRF